MNISPWTVYWLTRLDYINGFFAGTGLVLGIAGFFVGLFCLAERVNGKYTRRWFTASIIGLVSIVISCFIPDTKEAAAIILIPRIANNQKVAEIPNKFLDLANEWLDALKPKEKK